MGSIWKENWKRGAKKSSVSASDNYDLVRIEDLAGGTSSLEDVLTQGDFTGVSSGIFFSDGDNVVLASSSNISWSSTINPFGLRDVYIERASIGFIDINTTLGGSGDGTLRAGEITVPGAGNFSEQFGSGATASGDNSLAVGHAAQATAANSTVLGASATDGGFDSATVLGKSASATAQSATAIGASTSADSGSTAVGHAASATAANSTALGAGSTTGSAVSALAVGQGATADQSLNTAVGRGASATGTNSSTVLGASATDNGNNQSVAAGAHANVTGNSGAAFGFNTTAAQQGVSVGHTASAAALGSISIGQASSVGAASPNSLAIGTNATTTGTLGSAIGWNSQAVGDNSLALGAASTAGGLSSTALGHSSSASNSQATALGRASLASGAQSTALGEGASATASSATAVGRNATATGTAIGAASTATGAGTTAVGSVSSAVLDGTALGNGASAGFLDTIALGRLATATAASQWVVGSDGSPILTAHFGRGPTSATPQVLSLNATGGSGTDIAAGALQIAGGRSTGNATAGILELRTGTPGVSGTSAQTLATRLTISDTDATFTLPVTAPSISKISNGAAITVTDTADAGERVLYDPTGGTFQINAPSTPILGMRWATKNRSSSVTAVTISGNGSNIEDPTSSFSLAANFSLSGDGISVEWEYDGTQWVVV